MTRLPNFLCIGAQKAGTTWLYKNIDYHPDVWMPPVKEIFYFNRQSSLPLIIQMCHPKSVRQRELVLPGLGKRLRRMQKRLTLSHKHTPSSRVESKKALNLQWCARFFLLPHNDTWYMSLFAPSKGRITGDITPYYANLASERVAYINSLLPNAKIIYLLRNPIHRLWSQAGMRFGKFGHQDLAIVKEELIQEFLETSIKSQLADYVGNLETWRNFYPRHQIYVGFFDQLVQNPRDLLRDIYRFLDLDASEQFIPKTVHEKHNVGQYPPIPEHFARYLARQYYKQIEQLHKQFNNQYTASWLDSAKQYLQAQ
jgi:hypothetical protein